MKRIKVHMYSGNKEIKTRNFDKVFDVYFKNGKPGIDWNASGDSFEPLENFAYSVIFEDVEDGKLYHWSSINNRIEEYNKDIVLLNDMCYGCAKLNNGCAGTVEKVWNDCIYRIEMEDK